MEYQSDKICVAVVNFPVQHGDKDANLKKIKDVTVSAANQGAELVLFPEMCLTGYDFYDDETISKERKLAMAETVPGPATESIAEITKKLGIYVVFGMSETGDGKNGPLYNSAAVVGPEGVVGAYRKIHPYGSENAWCIKGDSPFMFTTKWGPVAVGICYDTYSFPELMRYYAAKGCRLYLNLTAIIREKGNDQAFEEGYLTYLKYGVLANQIFIASSNLVGTEHKSCFGGGSVIVGPKVTPTVHTYSACYGGNVQCDREGIFVATLDLAQAKRSIYQKNKYTGVPDYRPELYKAFE